MDERVAEQLEQRHPEEWAATTPFEESGLDSPSWRLRGYQGGEEEEAERVGHCSPALHDVSFFSPHSSAPG